MSFLQLVFSLDKTIERNNSNVTLTRNSILENVKLTDITTDLSLRLYSLVGVMLFFYYFASKSIISFIV